MTAGLDFAGWLRAFKGVRAIVKNVEWVCTAMRDTIGESNVAKQSCRGLLANIESQLGF